MQLYYICKINNNINVTIYIFYFSLGYRPFMMALQPQISLLDKFVIQQESIPSFMHPSLTSNHQSLPKLVEKNLENFSKNVSFYINIQ